MTRLIKQVYDKALFALALGAAGLSAGWYGRERTGIRKLRSEPVTPDLSGPAYVATEARSPQARVFVWPKASAQSRGSDWLYDVFTPPVITYNPGTRAFAVTSPRSLMAPVVAEPGLELLAVKREPYRLQLAGYFGGPGDYLAAFTSPLSVETLLARPGGPIGSLGLTLQRFAVRKVASEGGEVAAFAVVQEDETGAEVVLDSRTPKLTDTPLAVFKAPGVAGRSRDLHEGDTFASEGATCRIERIQLDPPEVVVARTSPGLPAPEMRVLRPAVPVAGPEVPPKPLPAKTATDVAHNEPAFPSP